MTIPDYQTLMLPLLRLASDNSEHSIRDAIEQRAAEFNLSPEERRELLPSGQQPTFDNRAHWARTYMKQAGLLDSPRRGYFKITPRGNDVLRGHPDRIDVGFLSQFEDFYNSDPDGKLNKSVLRHQEQVTGSLKKIQRRPKRPLRLFTRTSETALRKI